MLTAVEPQKLRSLLNNSSEVLITMHKGPDGDAIGSSLGLFHFFKKIGINALIVAPDSFPKFLHWMPGADQIIFADQQPEDARLALSKAALIFNLDFNHTSRLGEFESDILQSTLPKIVIDHHQNPSDFADLYYIDSTASSTAELVFRLIEEFDEVNHIDRDAATCLYTGLVTDTGSFRFSSVTPQVMQIAAALLGKGVNHVNIYNQIFDNSTLDRLKLRGYAISQKIVVIEDTGAAYISLTEKELRRFNYQRGDTEGLVNYALSIQGIHVAGFFYEKDGFIKLSLRSKGKVEVNTIAQALFNGGGHKMAAGGRSEESLEDTLKKFVNAAKVDFNLDRL